MIHFAGHPEACFALGDLEPNRNLNVISVHSENLRRLKKSIPLEFIRIQMLRRYGKDGSSQMGLCEVG